jgi:hypothetical protein
VQYLDLNLLTLLILTILYSRPDQPVARGQRAAHDTALCCPPQKRLKLENVFEPFPGEAEIERRSTFGTL